MGDSDPSAVRGVERGRDEGQGADEAKAGGTVDAASSPERPDATDVASSTAAAESAEGGRSTGSVSDAVGSAESPTRSDDGDRSLDTISQDEVFDVLSNERRRYLLYYLKQSDDEVVELSDISSQLAAWEQETTPEYIDYADRKNVHTALYQFHLPKMAEAGFLDYDKRSGRIELTDHARNLDVYLETVSGRDVPWGVYFLGLSLVTTAVGVASWLGLGPLAAVPTGVPALFVAVAFLVSSAVFAYRTHFEMRVEPVGASAERE
ncbi:DUF7344 domain-containing protein [Halobium salinum]|nr:hypothetical protein [Halobium salinum]